MPVLALFGVSAVFKGSVVEVWVNDVGAGSYGMEVTVTTGLFWKKSERRKVHREYACMWRFMDTGAPTPGFSVDNLEKAFNATQKLNQSMKGKP